MDSGKYSELKKIVADSYEITAEHFNSTRSKIAAADFRWAAEQIGADDKVFDAGCGNGRLLDYARIAPANYLGLDQSCNLLSFAKDAHPAHRFESGDLSSLGFLDNHDFSLVFCSAVISHIPGRKERIGVLKSFYEISSPEARLVISFWKMKKKYRRQLLLNWWKKISGQSLYGWRDLVFPWKDRQGKEVSPRYYYCYRAGDFKKDIMAAGWKIKQIRDDRFNYWVIASKG